MLRYIFNINLSNEDFKNENKRTKNILFITLKVNDLI